VVLWNAHAAVAQFLRLYSLFDDARVEPLAANRRVQHVAGKEVDEVHTSFSWIASCKLAVNVTFEKQIIFFIVFGNTEFP
jgi:hypothetical protein